MSSELPKGFDLFYAKKVVEGEGDIPTSLIESFLWVPTPQGYSFWLDEYYQLQRGISLSKEAKYILEEWIKIAESREKEDRMKPILKLEDLKKGVFYTVEELAPLVRVSERTVRRYCVEGVFKNATKIGGKNWLILGDDIFDLFPFLRKE